MGISLENSSVMTLSLSGRANRYVLWLEGSGTATYTLPICNRHPSGLQQFNTVDFVHLMKHQCEPSGGHWEKAIKNYLKAKANSILVILWWYVKTIYSILSCRLYYGDFIEVCQLLSSSCQFCWKKADKFHVSHTWHCQRGEAQNDCLSC